MIPNKAILSGVSVRNFMVGEEHIVGEKNNFKSLLEKQNNWIERKIYT